ncbi:MAG: DVU0259 family response regulator domain-containing protein [Thermodesulfobacteriota bacterium]
MNAKKKILVIDDDPVLVKYIVSLFSRSGYDTCQAKNGKEGFEVLQNEKPDLITLDLQMDEEWGPRFYRKLSQSPEFADTPVIVISGLAGKHAIKKAVAFLTKPFDPDKLLGIVKSTIG